MPRSIASATNIMLLVIILVSFWLRVWGIQFGLPFVYHPDEQQYILPAVGVVSGDFQPPGHYNPALYPYLIGLVYTLTYLGLKLFGAFPTFFDLQMAWADTMQPWTTGLIYLARYLTVGVGVLTTLVVYQLGRRAYGHEAGLGAAVFFGLTFLPAREAHFAVSDAPVALGIAVTLYLCIRLLNRAHWRDYVWVGIAIGLSAATKYSAGLLVLPLVAAHLLSHRYLTWSKRLLNSWLLGVAGLVAVASYLLASPYTLLEYQRFWADFSENLLSARLGFQGLDLDPAGGAIFYLKSLGWGMGWPLVILFLGAVLLALWRHRRVDLVLLVLPLFGFIYMQRQAMYFVRWLMPFLPPMAVLAAETVRVGSQYLVTRGLGQSAHKQIAQIPLSLVLVVLLTLPSTYMAYRANRLFNQPDTRTEALIWIQHHIPAGSTLAVQLLSPPWTPPLLLPGLNIGPYNFVPVPDGGIAEADLEQYRALNVQYIVASSFYYARPLLDKTHQAQLSRRMQRLDQEAELIALFQPYIPEYEGFFYHDQVYGPANDVLYRTQPGPVIRIYRLP